jgi:hypothetical protein
MRADAGTAGKSAEVPAEVPVEVAPMMDWTDEVFRSLIDNLETREKACRLYVTLKSTPASDVNESSQRPGSERFPLGSVVSANRLSWSTHLDNPPVPPICTFSAVPS